MKVNNGNPGSIRPERPREARPTPPSTGSPSRPASERTDRTDRVEISTAGRARASHLAPVESSKADRLMAIRQRVLEGAYDADGVVADVARRILERGDL